MKLRAILLVFMITTMIAKSVKANSGFTEGSSMERPITVNVDALPVTLDPSKLRDTIANWVLHLLANRLVQSSKSGLIKGDLAKSWTISDDGTRYLFHLKTNAIFSDGSTITSQDVVDSLNASIVAVKSGNLSFYTRSIAAVRAIDNATVEIILKKKMVGFLQVLGEATFSIFKKHKNEIIYSGNFIIHRDGPKYLEIVRKTDKQIFRFIEASFDEAEAMFKQKSLDILRTYGLTHVKRARSLSESRLIMKDERSYYVAFNTKSPLFNTEKKRNAYIEHFDVEALKKYLKEQQVEYSDSFLAPSFSMGRRGLLTSKSKKKSQGKLPNQTPKLIWLDSHELDSTIKVLFNKLQYTNTKLPKTAFLDAVNRGDYDMLIVGYGTTLRDLDAISLFFHSQSMHNFSKVSDDEMDSLLEQAWYTQNANKRLKIFSKILELNEKNSYYFTFSHTPLIFALNDTINIKSNRPLKNNERALSAPFFDLLDVVKAHE